MASLLPLLQDLLPMIMPSQVRVTRSHQLVPVPERAERPPWYQQPPHVVDEEQKSLTSDSDLGKNAEPILLFDHEPATAAAVKDGAAPGQRPIDEPAVFRKDAMVGVSDTMCATVNFYQRRLWNIVYGCGNRVVSGTVLTVKPRSASAIHHHGEQDAMIYAASGRGVLLISPAVDPVKAIRADFKGEAPTHEEEQPRRIQLSPGDFAFVPAWTEHQVVNESNDVDAVWVVTRNGGEALQVDLEAWGGDAIER